MKQLLLLISLFSISLAQSQSSALDSMKVANDSLDAQIKSILNKYEGNGYDYLVLRVYDSVYPITSRGDFIYRVDSCSRLHNLHVHTDYQVHWAGVGRIGRKSSDCVDEIGQIEVDLSEIENYFRAEVPNEIEFSSARFTLFGKINGKFIYETFEESFVSEHHSGMLHYVICAYFGSSCSH